MTVTENVVVTRDWTVEEYVGDYNEAKLRELIDANEVYIDRRESWATVVRIGEDWEEVARLFLFDEDDNDSSLAAE
jgi:hypothetical protein